MAHSETLTLPPRVHPRVRLKSVLRRIQVTQETQLLGCGPVHPQFHEGQHVVRSEAELLGQAPAPCL